MQTLQQSNTLSALRKTCAQFRMQFNQLAKRISSLPAPLYELEIRWKVFVTGPGLYARNHPASPLLEPVAQLDILHPVNVEPFIESAGFKQHLAARRYITGVVVRKVHRLIACDVVGIENSTVAKISKEWIGGLFPLGNYRSDDGCLREFIVILQMTLNQSGFSEDVVVDEDDIFAERFAYADVARRCCTRLDLAE